MEELEDTGERLIPDIHPGELASGAHIARYVSILEIVNGRRVLDIACGTGYGSKLLAGSAASVCGVDFSEAAIAYAREHYAASNVTYKVGDALAIPLADRSVDVVVSFETLEHLAAGDVFMREVKRVLTPDGLLLLSTPNRPESPRGNHYHVQEYTQGELERLAQRHFYNVNMYFQGVWFATAVFSERQYEGEWHADLEVSKTATQSIDGAAYLFAACSDQQPRRPSAGFTLASPWSARRQQYHEEVQGEIITDLKAQVEAARRDLGLDRRALHERYEALQRDYQRIVTSKGWRAYDAVKKVAKKLRKA